MSVERTEPVTYRVPDRHEGPRGGLGADFYDKRTLEKRPTSANPEMDGVVRRVQEWCLVRDGSRVLDFGCFDGYILRALRSAAKITGTGVDIAPEAIRLAAQITELDGLQFLVSDGVRLPFADGSFDVVVCSEILEHVPKVDVVLSELARVLVPGGRMYATMPNSLKDVFAPLQPLCRRIDRIEGHVRRMSREEFVERVGLHDLEPIQIRYRGFVFSAIWYWAFIYSPRVKRMGLSLIAKQQSWPQKLAKACAYSAMRFYLRADRLFGSYRGCMGIDAAFRRQGSRG